MGQMSKCCSAATSACAGVMVGSLGDDPRQRATMQQIAGWLEKLGMSEYASVLPRMMSTSPYFRT
jgi:hypothetical protein